LFPEGTTDGDFLDNETVKLVISEQGKRDASEVLTSSASRVWSMAKLKGSPLDQVPVSILRRVEWYPHDGYSYDNKGYPEETSVWAVETNTDYYCFFLGFIRDFTLLKGKGNLADDGSDNWQFNSVHFLARDSGEQFYSNSFTEADFPRVFKFITIVGGDTPVKEVVKTLGLVPLNGFANIISIAKGKVIPVTSSASGSPIWSMVSEESATPEPTLAGLADLVNAVQNDIHWLHLYAIDSEGDSVGHWDRIHLICEEYYTQLVDDYDSIAELSLQVGENLTHPNESASVIGFSNTEASLENGVTYSRAMQVLFRELQALTEYASRLDDVVGSKYGAADRKGISNYLQDFLQRWTTEQNYKTMRRLNSSYSGLFSGGGRCKIFSALQLLNSAREVVDKAMVNWLLSYPIRFALPVDLQLVMDGETVKTLSFTYKVNMGTGFLWIVDFDTVTHKVSSRSEVE
jgi:DNA-binding ferritin-like protein